MSWGSKWRGKRWQNHPGKVTGAVLGMMNSDGGIWAGFDRLTIFGIKKAGLCFWA